jgi:pimeloyl-ACP methyl ester carboxylesterase
MTRAAAHFSSLASVRQVSGLGSDEYQARLDLHTGSIDTGGDSLRLNPGSGLEAAERGALRATAARESGVGVGRDALTPLAEATGTWTATGPLAMERAFHTATLLPSGKVLVAGGFSENAGFLASAELYDPAAGTWAPTGPLATARWYHTATLLPSGKVLVVGGANNDSGFLASAELYDPATGTWAATGPLAVAPLLHTATLLPNGKVLVVGGEGSGGTGRLARAELYDTAAGTWAATGYLATAHSAHTATLLTDGKVLVAGGYVGSDWLASAELYDPATGTWAATGSLATARDDHTATLLPSGKVLVAGGRGSGGNDYLASIELYDPAAGTWAVTGFLATARSGHTATILPSGKVLVAGGFNSGSYLSSAELYDPATGNWSSTGNLGTAHYAHTATLLPNGKVLVAGGFSNGSYIPSAELYDSGTPICNPLSISVQPQSQTVFVQGSKELNQTANLTVTATGTGPFTYQWYKGASGDTTNPIAAANASSYSFARTSFDRSSYWVRVQDVCGAHIDSSAALVVFTDKRPLIFIPGIAGSVLFEAGNRELWPGFPCFYDNLTLDPSVPTHSIFASDVLRRVLLSTVYDGLLARLVDDGYRSGQNQTLFLFPYDWRRSNVSAAVVFQDQINLVRSLFPDMKVDIVAHSMGGMVAQRYVMDHSSDHGVNEMITIGTPWLGAPKAINVLETGQFLDFLGICNGSIKSLSQWFPGMHELIPSRKYFDLSILSPFREASWDINLDGSIDTYDYVKLLAMLDGRYAPSTPGLNNLHFHNLTGQDDGRLAPSDISYYHIHGRLERSGHPIDSTIGQVMATRGMECIGGNGNGRFCYLSNYYDLKLTPGDGTVPSVSATRRGGGQDLNEPRSVVDLPFNADHVGLCSDTGVQNRVLRILSGPNLSAAASSTVSATAEETEESENSYYLQVIGNPSIKITDAFGHSSDVTSDSVGSDVSGVASYIMGDKAFMLVLATDQTYTVTFDSGVEPLTVNITKGTGDLPNQAIRYQDLVLPAGAKVMLKFTPQGVEPLRYDADGDGIFEGTITPTAAVSGTAAGDTEPPVVTVGENRQQTGTVVTITVSDSGSGVKKINYSFDGTNYQTYSAPLIVNPYRVRTIYAFADDNVANRSGLVEFQLTALPPIVFVEQGTTNRAVALDSVTWVRAPFLILTNNNFSADRHTRVILFISGLLLSQLDASIVTVTASAFPLPVESVGTVTGVPGLNASYIVVRLPDGLPQGDLPLTIAVGGVANTNSVTLWISP